MKWIGSKNSISPLVTSHFPKNIETYYEPFAGGAKIFFYLLQHPNAFSINKFVISDINSELIQIYNIVKNDPFKLIKSYSENWQLFSKNKEHYYKVRLEYNETKNPLLLYFLTRTSINGLIRYNSKGEFNSSHHPKRQGMQPNKIEKIILYYNKLLNNVNVQFLESSFDQIKVLNNKDVVYLDPPYTNSGDLYGRAFNVSSLFNWIEKLPCSWFLNLNAVSGSDNNEINIPLKYDEKKQLFAGKSYYRKVSNQKEVNTYDYFYFKLKGLND